MIEEVTLPANSGVICSIALPVSNYFLHTRVRSKGRKHMQVIGHEEEERQSPETALPIKTRRCKERLRSLHATELVLAFGFAANRNEENRVRGSDKMRRIVRQCTASNWFI